MFYKCVNHAPSDDHGHAQAVRNGNKFFTVDIHSHIHVHKADDMLASLPELDADQRTATKDADQYGGPVDNNPVTIAINKELQTTLRPKLTDPEERIIDMDKQGVDVQAISPSPFHYNYDKPAEFAR